MAELISVTINDGKYTIRQVSLGKWECLRHGEPWPTFEHVGPDNLHVALALAINEVWQALGATTEAEALERVTILQAIARGDVWVTPRHRRHYAVHSVSGAHVGLWPTRETAVEVLRDYPGGTLTELVEVPHHGYKVDEIKCTLKLE